jgi:hypothetical protein
MERVREEMMGKMGREGSTKVGGRELMREG